MATSAKSAGAASDSAAPIENLQIGVPMIAGALAVSELIRQFGVISDATTDSESASDTRDYGAMLGLLRVSVDRYVIHGQPAEREGFLRALVDVLAAEADGAGVDRDWDPVAAIAVQLSGGGHA